jgi:hypothetical protein
MAVARLHIGRGRRYARFGKQSTDCQIQRGQGTFPAAALRAVSVDPAEQSRERQCQPLGPEPLHSFPHRPTLLAGSRSGLVGKTLSKR